MFLSFTQLIEWKQCISQYNCSLLRHWRHSGSNDHRALWKGDSGIPGEEPDCVGVRDGWVTRAAQEHQPRLLGVRLHLLYRTDDYLLCLADLLLHPEDQRHQRTGPQSGLTQHTQIYQPSASVFSCCSWTKHA